MVYTVDAEPRDAPEHGGTGETFGDEKFHDSLVERPVAMFVVLTDMDPHEDFIAGEFCHYNPPQMCLAAMMPTQVNSRQTRTLRTTFAEAIKYSPSSSSLKVS